MLSSNIKTFFFNFLKDHQKTGLRQESRRKVIATESSSESDSTSSNKTFRSLLSPEQRLDIKHLFRYFVLTYFWWKAMKKPTPDKKRCSWQINNKQSYDKQLISHQSRRFLSCPPTLSTVRLFASPVRTKVSVKIKRERRDRQLKL